MIKAFEVMKELSPAQQIAVQGDAAEEYSNNWWEKMVVDASGLTTGAGYLSYRTTIDTMTIDFLLEKGNPEEQHKHKNGNYKIGSIFSTKKAYSNYRSNKSIISNAIDNNIPLLEDGEPRPKSVVQNDLKALKEKEARTAFEKCTMYAERIKALWEELTPTEQHMIDATLPNNIPF